nr:carbonic anhydrase family protein [Nocardia amamiensis]
MSAVAAVLVFPACGRGEQPEHSRADVQGSAPAHAGPHWDYDADGPDHWADLDRDYLACKSGHQQSPIDLPSHTRLEPSEHITIDYHSVPGLTLRNTGHTVQANLPAGNGNRIVIDGVPFDLAQFHFHLPSEHTLDGAGTTMEVHFVHKSAAGKLAVLGVLMQATPDPSPFDPSSRSRRMSWTPRPPSRARSTCAHSCPVSSTSSGMRVRSPRHRAARACPGRCSAIRSRWRRQARTDTGRCSRTATGRPSR